MEELPSSPQPQGVQVIQQTLYSAFVMVMGPMNLGAVNGLKLGFVTPYGHEHGFFLTPQSVADLRLQMASHGYSGLETVKP